MDAAHTTLAGKHCTVKYDNTTSVKSRQVFPFSWDSFYASLAVQDCGITMVVFFNICDGLGIVFSESLIR